MIEKPHEKSTGKTTVLATTAIRVCIGILLGITLLFKMVRLDCFNQSRPNPLYDKPARERHIVSMASSLISVILLVISLSLPSWATANVNGCGCQFGLTSVYCLKPQESICRRMTMTEYYGTSQEILISCVLSISVLTMISSLIAAFISLGFPRERLEFLRHYSVFNIVSLLCIILVAGFWLSVVETLPVGNEFVSAKDTLLFGYAYYIYIGGGVASLVAACLNLLRARSAVERRMLYRLRFRRQLQQQRRPVQLLRMTQPPEGQQDPVVRTNEDEEEEEQEGQGVVRPPEYSAVATTEFMGDDEEESRDVEETTDDTAPLVSPPPPYTP